MPHKAAEKSSDMEEAPLEKKKTGKKIETTAFNDKTKPEKRLT